MASPIDNDDWELVGELRWEAKRRRPCPNCDGRGKIGGHFHSMDPERPCYRCNQTGKVEPPFHTQPRIPSGLIMAQHESLRKYFKDRASAKEEGSL